MVHKEDVIENLCKRYTDLTSHDIAVIEGVAAVLQPLANLEDADIFIDCPSLDGDAIVVAEAKPEYVPSSYKNTVVGLLAKQENEPAVARTLRLGVATKHVKAITQESTNVIQSVEPIRNRDRVIGVLIREKRVAEQNSFSEGLHFSKQSYKRIASAITHMVGEDNWLTECIDEALIIINKNGFVSFRNSLAHELYHKLGYVNDPLGQPYQNICLVNEPPSMNGEDVSSFTEIETKVAHSFLIIRRIYLDSKQMSFALVIRDITEKKEREKELILKSVAIQEMHHRIKNNLQTVASLLRLQVRRAGNSQAKHVLQESMSRILSIAVTHELLSQGGIDSVNIRDVILNIRNNTLRNFADTHPDIEVAIAGDDFQIDSDIATSVALVVNELLQNSLQYAFVNCIEAVVQIVVTWGELYSTIKVIDNGCGFDMTKNINKHLGLSIVSTLVKDKLGGNLNIESNEHGTCVTFDFKTR